MNNLAKLGVISATALVPALANAQAFSWDLGATYTTEEADVSDIKVEEDNFAVYARYYFDRVDPRGRALREAPFLERASYVGAGADIRQLDDNAGNAIDTDAYRLMGRLVGKDSGWYLDGSYVDADAQLDAGNPGIAVVGYSPGYEGLSVALGRYLATNTTLEVNYADFDYKGDFFIQSIGGKDSQYYGLGVKHVGPITGTVDFSIEAHYRWLDLEVNPLGNQVFEDSGSVYDVTATLYPMPTLGIGVSYADSDILQGAPYLTTNSIMDDGLSAFVDWFVTDRFSARISYNNRSYDLDEGFPELPGDVESDSLLFGVAYRL